MEPDSVQLESPEIIMLRHNKQDGFNYVYRRYNSWTQIYEMYRDTVQTNRLTQRQSVNLPLMKQTVRSLLKDVDDMPVLQFENLDNDKSEEIFFNEYWKDTVTKNQMDLQDIVDKRQVFLFGRSFDQWQIIDGRLVMTVQDPMDILIQRYCNPFDLHSSRFLIHTHIFKPLADLDEAYGDEPGATEAIENLKQFYSTQLGILRSKTNQQMLEEKNRKMVDMGVLDVESPVLGETYVEISLHFVYRSAGEEWEDKDGTKHKTTEKQIFLYVEVDDMEILLKKPLEEIIGKTSDNFWQTHFPYESWADDLERQDFWSDGVGDIIRGTNGIANVWYSQEVESRTLRSLGMHYYDATVEGFNPQSYQPKAFGFYGVPGKPQDLIQKVDLPNLEDSLEDLNFVIGVGEKASGATSTQQGVPTEQKITLGEVQLDLGEAKERSKGMSKFYTPAWQRRGLMFIKFIEAGADKLDAVKIHKKGKNTSAIYSREVDPGDWKFKTGYRVKVWSQDDKNSQDQQKLQKLSAAVQNMPGNPKLLEVYNQKLLEWADLTPDQINEIMEFEKQKQEMMASQNAIMQQGGVQPTAPGSPALPGSQPAPALPPGGQMALPAHAGA